MPYHVTRARFSELVELALKELPPQFAEFLEEVPVQIEDQPSAQLLKQLGLDEDELLFGVYQGASLMTRAESEGRGKGARFTVTLPLLHANSDRAQLPAHANA